MNSLDRVFFTVNLDVFELWLATMILLVIFTMFVVWIVVYVLELYNVPLLNEYKSQITKIREEVDAIRREITENIKPIKGTDKTT